MWIQATTEYGSWALHHCSRHHCRLGFLTPSDCNPSLFMLEGFIILLDHYIYKTKAMAEDGKSDNNVMKNVWKEKKERGR